jgi:hypothetical protein
MDKLPYYKNTVLKAKQEQNRWKLTFISRINVKAGLCNKRLCIIIKFYYIKIIIIIIYVQSNEFYFLSEIFAKILELNSIKREFI